MKKLLLCVLLILCSCSKTEISLIGQTYQTEINNLKITLSFQENGHFTGKAVNSYFGTYKLDKEKINFTLQGSTITMGIPVQLELENNYLKTLKEINTFELKDQILILKGHKIEYQFHLLNTN